MVLLSIKNQTVEDICDIVCIDKAHILPSQLIVASFSRDAHILNSSSSDQITIVPEKESGFKKFRGFMGYLFDRKKVSLYGNSEHTRSLLF